MERSDLRGPGQLQQRLGAARAVAGGLELVRARGTARGPAGDAAEVVEREPDVGSTAALSSHWLLLEHEMLSDGVKKRSRTQNGRK